MRLFVSPRLFLVCVVWMSGRTTYKEEEGPCQLDLGARASRVEIPIVDSLSIALAFIIYIRIAIRPT